MGSGLDEADTLISSAEDDELFGGPGDDTLNALGVDLMSGDAGNDVTCSDVVTAMHDLIANRRTTLTESDTLHFKST